MGMHKVAQVANKRMRRMMMMKTQEVAVAKECNVLNNDVET